MSRVSAVLAALISGLISVTMTGTSQAQNVSAKPPELVFLLPEHFEGWTCVDFGVVGAAPLPREGNSFVVRTRPGDVVKTSDKLAGYFIPSEGWLEINGTRHPLPEDVYARRQTPTSDSKDSVQRYCVFFGTEDESDAAGIPPGAKPEPMQGIPGQEREALLALYRATDGDHWTHRVGWLGPSGTECSWHGVECWSRYNKPGVTGLELFENNLNGTVPQSLAQLTQLDRLNVYRNHLSGMLPERLIQQWRVGTLDFMGDASLLTDISKIEFEFSPSALLCGRRRIDLDADGRAVQYEKRCRSATLDDRTTFCEVKEGKVWPGQFATLGWLLEKNDFFHLSPEYYRTVTEAAFETTQVTRNGNHYTVENYAAAGPIELSVIQLAIQGVAASLEWEKTSTQPECPAPMPGKSRQ